MRPRWRIVGSFVICAACQGAEGPPGTPGDQNDPAVSVPAAVTAFLGHPLTLSIAGDGSHFDEGDVTVSAAGFEVTSSVVASPTALVVELLPVDAAVGLTDVLVECSDGVFLVEDAIEVRPSLLVSAVSGTTDVPTQVVLDLSFPDLRYPLLSGAPITIELDGATGASFDVLSVAPYGARVRLFADAGVDFSASDLRLEGESTLGPVTHRAPAPLAMAAREALPFDVAAPPAGVAQPTAFGSVLYSIAPTEIPSEVKVDLVVHATQGQPDAFLALLPASGSWGDLLSFGTSVTMLSVDEPFSLLVIDRGSPGAYSFDLVATATGALAFEIEPNDSCAGSEITSSFPTTITASLEGANGIDWYTVAITEENAGRRLRSRTTAGDADTDIELLLYAGCDEVIAGPIDIDLHENLLSPVLAEGYYALRVRPSQTFPFNGSNYKTTFSLEP